MKGRALAGKGDQTMTRPKTFVAAALVLSAAALAACVEANDAGPGEPSFAEMRKAAERFKDVKVALAEGYLRDPGDSCETAPMMGKPAADGAMGVHYFRPDLLGVTSAPDAARVDGNGVHVDFLKPAVLLYEPQADGSMELVAVENLVFQKSWHAAGNKAPPSFHGVTYNAMADDPATPLDEAHKFEPHYDLHAWIYRENPKGVFVSFNPAVNCTHHKGHQMPMPPAT
jgi:hypothetical protein